MKYTREDIAEIAVAGAIRPEHEERLRDLVVELLSHGYTIDGANDFLMRVAALAADMSDDWR